MPTMTLHDVPTELHAWLEQQARRHGRSMNKEAIDLLDRQRRESHGAQPLGPRNRIGTDEILAIGERVARAPAFDERSADEILGYDDNGLPR
jgi:antitoxin VapB